MSRLGIAIVCAAILAGCSGKPPTDSDVGPMPETDTCRAISREEYCEMFLDYQTTPCDGCRLMPPCAGFDVEYDVCPQMVYLYGDWEGFQDNCERWGGDWNVGDWPPDSCVVYDGACIGACVPP